MMSRKFSRHALTTGLGLLALLSTAEAAEVGGFRGVSWGATKAEVRATEKYALHHDIDGEIAYWDFEFAGVAAGLIYTFEDGKLVRAHFLSRNQTADPGEEMADYERFRAQLEEHFGPHRGEEWVWPGESSRGAPEDPLEALTSGAAKLEARWELEGSNLTLFIAGRDGAVRTLRAVFEPRVP